MSFLTGLWNRFEQRIAAWVTLAGLPLLLASYAPFHWAETNREFIYAGGFVLVCLGCAATFLITSARLHRRARYAEAMANVREAVRRIADEDSADGHRKDEKRHALKAAMDELAKAFSILTVSNCRCCIKMVTRKESAFGVVTLSRNSSFREQERFKPIDYNTGFNDLFQDKEMKMRWFFGNNLPEAAKAGEYRNTNPDWRRLYLSTLVWPIRRVATSEEQTEFIGFLCVDSNRTRRFSEEYDYPVGALLADTLCPFLLRMANSPNGAIWEKEKPEQVKSQVEDANPRKPNEGAQK